MNQEADSDPNVKVEAAKWFKRMEDGDEDALKNWRVWREMSVKKYESEYDRLNVKFDIYVGESLVGKESMADSLIRLEEMGLVSEADGAKLVDLEKWKLGKAVVRKKGTHHLSLSTDLASNFCSTRWDLYIPHSRHRWCDRAV